MLMVYAYQFPRPKAPVIHPWGFRAPSLGWASASAFSRPKRIALYEESL